MSTRPNLIQGRYETLAEWERGAQSKVCLGKDRKTNEYVALKIWGPRSEADRHSYDGR